MTIIQITDTMPTRRGLWVGAWNAETGGRLAFEHLDLDRTLTSGQVFQLVVDGDTDWRLRGYASCPGGPALDLYLPFVSANPSEVAVRVRRPKGAIPWPAREYAAAG